MSDETGPDDPAWSLAVRRAGGRRGGVGTIRAARPTGVSPGTRLLILGELSCWLMFGRTLGHYDVTQSQIAGRTGISPGRLSRYITPASTPH
jgi:hypothetical protein